MEHTKEPKLLTEAEWINCLTRPYVELAATLAELRERGLIAPDPPLTPLQKAVQIVGRRIDLAASTAKPIENHWAVQCVKEGIEYGKELRPTPTREMVREAFTHVFGFQTEYNIDRLHKAILEQMQ